MDLYAAYGANLDPERMALRAPHSPLRGLGWVNGWRLTFAEVPHAVDGALATLVEDPDSQVYVSVYDVTPGDEQALDEWEGLATGLSRKIHLRVHTLDGDVVAWAHVLDAYEGGLPAAHYLGMLGDAAEAGGAPDDYVHNLRARPCQSSDTPEHLPPNER